MYIKLSFVDNSGSSLWSYVGFLVWVFSAQVELLETWYWVLGSLIWCANPDTEFPSVEVLKGNI